MWLCLIDYYSKWCIIWRNLKITITGSYFYLFHTQKIEVNFVEKESEPDIIQRGLSVPGQQRNILNKGREWYKEINKNVLFK